MTSTLFSAVKSSDASNKNVRNWNLNGEAEKSHDWRGGVIMQKGSTVWNPLTVSILAAAIFLDSRAVCTPWVWAEYVRLCCLFFLLPRCQTPGLLCASSCRCFRRLFGPRRQRKTFTNTMLFLARVAGIAPTGVSKTYFSCQIVCFITLLLLFRRMLCFDLVRDSCCIYSMFVSPLICYTGYDIHCILYLSFDVLFVHFLTFFDIFLR